MWQFLVDGGVVMLFLVLCSIASVAVVIERVIALRWKNVIPPEVEQALGQNRSTVDVAQIRTVCQVKPSALSRLAITAIDHLGWPKAETVDAVQTHARKEIVRLERGLVVLEVIVGIAPLLGLVGAVHGLIELFGGLGKTGVTDNAIVAKGIAIALNTTLVGLLVAIPTLIAWSYFNKKVEALTVEMENLCDGFLRQQYRLQEKAGAPVTPPETSTARTR
jgi:biopolymer transport protein ExbB